MNFRLGNFAIVHKPVYTAPSEEAALGRFAEFADAWQGRKYPAIVKPWENAWDPYPANCRQAAARDSEREIDQRGTWRGRAWPWWKLPRRGLSATALMQRPDACCRSTCPAGLRVRGANVAMYGRRGTQRDDFACPETAAHAAGVG